MTDPTAMFSNAEGVIVDTLTTTYATPVAMGENVAIPKATSSAASTAAAIESCKVFGLVKDTADPWRVGDTIYWDFVNSQATRRPTGTRIGFASDTQTAASAIGNVYVMIAPGTVLYQILAASSTLTSWTTFTAFSNGTYTVPANFLVAGMTLRIRGRVTWVGINSTNTVQLEVKFISTAILLNVARNATAGDVVTFDAEVVIRTTGASGTWVSSGQSFDGTIGGAPAVNVYAVSSTAIDTTSATANKVIVGAVCSVSNAGNQAILDELTVAVQR